MIFYYVGTYTMVFSQVWLPCAVLVDVLIFTVEKSCSVASVITFAVFLATVTYFIFGNKRLTFYLLGLVFRLPLKEGARKGHCLMQLAD